MIGDYAKYTVVLRSLMENPQTKTKLDEALATYQLYKAKNDHDIIPTRELLNQKILDHYKYREIGFETVGRFLDELRITMNEIMPYYNEMFKTVEIMGDLDNIFNNVDIVETFEEERTNTSSNEGTATNETSSTGKETVKRSGESETDISKSDESSANGTVEKSNDKRVSDTPQNNVNDLNNYLTEHEKNDGSETVTSANETNSNESAFTETSESATTNTENESEGRATTQGTSESAGTVKHTMTRKGNYGVNTYAHDMKKYREIVIDVVDKIVRDRRLNELFMLVW